MTRLESRFVSLSLSLCLWNTQGSTPHNYFYIMNIRTYNIIPFMPPWKNHKKGRRRRRESKAYSPLLTTLATCNGNRMKEKGGWRKRYICSTWGTWTDSRIYCSISKIDLDTWNGNNKVRTYLHSTPCRRDRIGLSDIVEKKNWFSFYSSTQKKNFNIKPI